jgi:hypothetical protein
LGATANFYEAFDGTKTLIVGTDSSQAGVKVGSLTNHPLYLASNNTAQLEITHPGLFVFNDGAGGTRMTLNSTGLGLGGTPSGANRFAVFNGATQALTLDTSGNLLVGTTAPLGGNTAKLHLSTDSGTTRWAVGPYSAATSFIISAVGGSGVYLNGTAATSWSSASDERLKDIIEPITNAVAKVGSLRAVIGKFKFDKLNTRKPFLMAQDVLAVLPEAVDVSNPDQFGLAYTDIIPLLVAAIKELTAEVNALKNA